jgi:hypothetical protein
VTKVNEALIGLIGVLVGVGVMILLRWLDKTDRFRDMTFEKRLVAHQDAYRLNQTLYEALGTKSTPDIRIILNEIKDWMKNNSLYLDSRSSRSMLALFSSALQYCLHPDRPSGLQPTWDLLDINLKDITHGIGTNHLPRINDNETPSKTKVTDSNKGLFKQIKDNWASILFLFVFVGAVFYLIITSYQVPLSDSFTITTRLKYIAYSLSSVAALVATLLSIKNKGIFLAVIIAVNLFLLGMIFELLGFVIASH